METFSTRFWRHAVRMYVQWFPVNRGKRRLMESMAPFYTSSKPQICELPGGAHLLADLSEHVQRWIYFFGVYEESTVRWFRQRLGAGMVVLDIGAHVGQYSLIAASAVGPSGRVHSFEPSPVNFRRLAANLEMNEFRNVQVHQLAVSDTAGEATLFVPSHNNQGEASLQADQDDAQHVKVECVTIDQWARSADLGSPARIDLVKIDVQGLEGKVLKGAQEAFLRFRPVIVCEFEERFLRGMGSSSVDLKTRLIENGYSIHRIGPSGLLPVRTEEVHDFENLVLVPAPAN
jgi:FkbM family methyltransferase